MRVKALVIVVGADEPFDEVEMAELLATFLDDIFGYEIQDVAQAIVSTQQEAKTLVFAHRVPPGWVLLQVHTGDSAGRTGIHVALYEVDSIFRTTPIFVS